MGFVFGLGQSQEAILPLPFQFPVGLREGPNDSMVLVSRLGFVTSLPSLVNLVLFTTVSDYLAPTLVHPCVVESIPHLLPE